MTAITQSMTVYGDGRVELRKEIVAAQRILGAHEMYLERAELESLVRIAVDHQLLEWDSAAIRVRQMRTGKSQSIGSDDSASINIIVTLETYDGEGGRAREIHGIRNFTSAKLLYPDFPEYQGIDSLLRYMVNAYRKAESTP